MRVGPAVRDKDAVAERLLRVRRDTGLTQAAFAERVGFAKRTYLAWERGESAPSIWLLKALLDEFGIDPDWVIDGPEETPRRYDPKKIDWSHFAQLQAQVSGILTGFGIGHGLHEVIPLVAPIYEAGPENHEGELAKLDAAIKVVVPLARRQWEATKAADEEAE